MHRERTVRETGSLQPVHRELRVVFDLDDTLYPERAFAMSGFRAAEAWAHARWGVSGLAEDMIRMLDSGHLGAVFRLALERHHLVFSETDLAGFIDAYRRHKPELTLFDDAMTALEHCASAGPIGLITDGTDFVQENKVRALGIAARFQRIIYTGALGGRAFHKPHPRAFELMETALAGPGAHFVYVGDNPAKDFVAPNQRGWTTIQVVRDTGIHDPTAVTEAGAPHHEIPSLHDLPPVLEEVRSRRLPGPQR